MDTKIVKDIVSPLDQVCPTDLPTQPGVYTREQSGAIQPDPLPSRRPEGSMKELLPASLPNPSFILQPPQQTAIFIPAVTRIA